MFTPIDKNLLIAAMESAIYHACVNANVVSLHAIETGVSSLRQRFDLDADSVSDADIFSLVDTIERAKIPTISQISELNNDTNIADRVVSFLWKNILEKPSVFPSDWGMLANKPTTFPPATHTHEAQAVAWSEVTDKPTTFPPAEHTHEAQAVAWSEVTDKPTTFPPAEHTHAAAAVAWTDVTDKPATFTPHMAMISYVGNELDKRVVSFPGDFYCRFIFLHCPYMGKFLYLRANEHAQINNDIINQVEFTASTTWPKSEFNYGYTYNLILWG